MPQRMLTAVLLVACLSPTVLAQSGGPSAPAAGSLFLYPERVPLADSRRSAPVAENVAGFMKSRHCVEIQRSADSSRLAAPRSARPASAR